tara:strand:+ start:74 stop:202 length:129 start_codon:yes stop_codon:yes gene_type:complete
MNTINEYIVFKKDLDKFEKYIKKTTEKKKKESKIVVDKKEEE